MNFLCLFSLWFSLRPKISVFQNFKSVAFEDHILTPFSPSLFPVYDRKLEWITSSWFLVLFLCYFHGFFCHTVKLPRVKNKKLWNLYFPWVKLQKVERKKDGKNLSFPQSKKTELAMMYGQMKGLCAFKLLLFSRYVEWSMRSYNSFPANLAFKSHLFVTLKWS